MLKVIGDRLTIHQMHTPNNTHGIMDRGEASNKRILPLGNYWSKYGETIVTGYAHETNTRHWKIPRLVVTVVRSRKALES